jgi:hypothetical protein
LIVFFHTLQPLVSNAFYPAAFWNLNKRMINYLTISLSLISSYKRLRLSILIEKSVP